MKNKQIIFVALSLVTCSCFATATDTNYVDEASLAILSQETNSLKSGLLIDNTNNVIVIQNGRIENKVYLVTLNTSTNQVCYYYFWYKKPESPFEISMVDFQGKTVPKTALGKTYGQSLPEIPANTFSTKAKSYGLAMNCLSAKADELNDFDLQKTLPQCFELEKPGDYKFTLIQHIYGRELHTNGSFLKPITFSPITVDVRVEKDLN